MALADYQGRTVDLVAYLPRQGVSTTTLAQELASPGNGGQVIAGIQKLVQRFLLELLTERGSMIYLPARGTDLMTKARQGFIRTHLDAQAAFAAALLLAQTNLQGEESREDPTDERFAGAELLEIVAIPGHVQARIRVTSQAGSSAVILAPLPILPSRV
jgi:hypothetical protein